MLRGLVLVHFIHEHHQSPAFNDIYVLHGLNDEG
jgi:hypothetical protein